MTPGATDSEPRARGMNPSSAGARDPGALLGAPDDIARSAPCDARRTHFIFVSTPHGARAPTVRSTRSIDRISARFISIGLVGNAIRHRSAGPERRALGPRRRAPGPRLDPGAGAMPPTVRPTDFDRCKQNQVLEAPETSSGGDPRSVPEPADGRYVRGRCPTIRVV